MKIQLNMQTCEWEGNVEQPNSTRQAMILPKPAFQFQTFKAEKPIFTLRSYIQQWIIWSVEG